MKIRAIKICSKFAKLKVDISIGIRITGPVFAWNQSDTNVCIIARHCFACLALPYECALCAFPELKEAVEDVLPSLIEHGVTVLLMSKQSDTPGIQSFSDEVEEASDDPIPRSFRSHITFKSPAIYIYTSGTTGTWQDFVLLITLKVSFSFRILRLVVFL